MYSQNLEPTSSRVFTCRSFNPTRHVFSVPCRAALCMLIRLDLDSIQPKSISSTLLSTKPISSKPSQAKPHYHLQAYFTQHTNLNLNLCNLVQVESIRLRVLNAACKLSSVCPLLPSFLFGGRSYHHGVILLGQGLCTVCCGIGIPYSGR